MEMDVKTNLINRLENRSAKISVLGLGYVGLPLAVVFAEAGFNVVGVDPNQDKVDTLNRGESYVLDVPGEKVAHLVREGRLQATTDFSVLKDADAISICVPTPLRKTGDPDLSFIVAAAEDLSKYVHPGMVVVLESTTYPGTTRELILPKLTQDGKYEVGKDIFVAFWQHSQPF